MADLERVDWQFRLTVRGATTGEATVLLVVLNGLRHSYRSSLADVRVRREGRWGRWVPPLVDGSGAAMVTNLYPGRWAATYSALEDGRVVWHAFYGDTRGEVESRLSEALVSAARRSANG